MQHKVFIRPKNILTRGFILIKFYYFRDHVFQWVYSNGKVFLSELQHSLEFLGLFLQKILRHLPIGCIGWSFSGMPLISTKVFNIKSASHTKLFLLRRKYGTPFF